MGVKLEGFPVVAGDVSNGDTYSPGEIRHDPKKVNAISLTERLPKVTTSAQRTGREYFLVVKKQLLAFARVLYCNHDMWC